MKKRNFVSAFIMGAVLSSTSLSFSCNAMDRDERGTTRPTAASAAAAVATSAEQSEVQSAREEDMMLVHLTKYCRKGNIMIPGSVARYTDRRTNQGTTDKQNLAIAKLSPPTRVTLHWTLNGTIPAHEGFDEQLDRSLFPYAVMVPMKSVKQQIIGGNQLDMFTIGPVSLSSDSIIVMALDKPINTEGMNSQIILFNPSQENINDAISRTLRGLNKPVIKGDFNQKVRLTWDMLENQDPEQALDRYNIPYKATDYPPQIIYEVSKLQLREKGARLVGDAELNEITVNGVRVREKAYLRDIFAQNHWDFCLHFNSIIGSLDLEWLPQIFRSVRVAVLACELDSPEIIYSDRFSESQIKEEEKRVIKKIDALFTKLTAELSKRKASSFVQSGVKTWKKNIDKWVKALILPKQNVSFLKVGTSEERARLKRYITDHLIERASSGSEMKKEKSVAAAAAASS